MRLGGTIALPVLLLFGLAGDAQTARPRAAAQASAEQRAAQAMEQAKANGPALYAFLRAMPKGGDLHNHITGAVYAETYVEWAVENNLCVDRASLGLTTPPCGDGQVAAAQAAGDTVLYREMIDAWSMRGAGRDGKSGHDHFFDTFLKFNAAVEGHMGLALAEAAQRAADGNVTYLELMSTPDNAQSIGFGSKIGWNDDFATMRQKMLAGGMQDLVTAARKNLDAWDAQKAQALKCGTQNATTGCAVTIRHIYPALRAFTREQVFAQLLLAFELAKQDPRMVAVNMVQPEDWRGPMGDFRLHMRMIDFLKKQYPSVHITLHAGELAPGLVPPEGLRFHIRESIEVGKAERIGHGVAIMYEDNPRQLLAEMAKRNIMVEVCLTSNDGILGVKGREHPLSQYLAAGVPVALATDDEGVSRGEMTREYQKAVEEQGLSYPTLKSMARTSIEHAFLKGASLWSDAKRFTVTGACAKDKPTNPAISVGCQKFLDASEKAREQWRVEKKLAEFEAGF
ncbi:MAG TPA: adenosine deaminase [Clostridia bacterium]|nr:adenosine deaminase [Clostridia bacterium]